MDGVYSCPLGRREGDLKLVADNGIEHKSGALSAQSFIRTAMTLFHDLGQTAFGCVNVSKPGGRWPSTPRMSGNVGLPLSYFGPIAESINHLYLPVVDRAS